MNSAPPVTVIIDPGHGGTDPGVVRPGIREADVNLAVARIVADLVRKAGIPVVLTRTSDVAVSLDERCRSASGAGRRLFVSLHVNAPGVLATNAPRGAQVYYYRRDTAGYGLGTALRAALVRAGLRTWGDEDGTGPIPAGMWSGARLAVLRGTACPAALVEMGFATHPQDVSFLTSPEGQCIVAAAIADGIMSYVTRPTVTTARAA